MPEMQRECHRCPLNGTGSEECLKCHSDQPYHYPFGRYLNPTYDPPAPEKDACEPVTHCREDDEDRFRRGLYLIFDLLPMELLALQGIMRGRSIDETGKELTDLIERQHGLIAANPHGRVTRHHVFQLRRSMLRKLGENFSDALLTSGQKKVLDASEPPPDPLQGRFDFQFF